MWIWRVVEQSTQRGELIAALGATRGELAEARAVVAAYTPVALDGSALAEAVRRLVERFERETGLRVELQIGAGVRTGRDP
jgi:signal transduction histidine kinase